ncbi:hypothetical protein HOLleu_26416 [Holothuria leucospilota]|uniref:Uncharacterized protein n=1 Tax=Holothuria leucospilota TaxID=206669 RepID=A0A9Q1BNX4_HOLLE|nr:hypothetical protein HOLleu_26416 [Holothuria leucospilota]
MEGLKPPESLSLSGNLSESWRKWRQTFKLHMIASGMDTKTASVQYSTLLNVIGGDVLEEYNTFHFSDAEPKDDVKTILQKFEYHFTPKNNFTYERHLFNS